MAHSDTIERRLNALIELRTEVLDELPRTIAGFPENEIKILDEDYLSEAFIKGVREGFDRDGIVSLDSFEIFEPRDKRDRIKEIAHARKMFVRSFVDPLVLDRFSRLRAIAAAMVQGNFASAEEQLKGLIALPPVALRFDFESAFNSRPVEFFTIEFQENPTQGKPPIRKKIPGTIPAYAGPKPSGEPGQRLVARSDFLSKGPEHRFQTELLQAEINVGLRKFGEAITLYDDLLAATPPGSPRRKFIALRSAFAHLAFGDQLFRKQRVLSDQDRQDITDQYDRAVQLLQENGVSPDNPLRQQVEAHASQQKTKLQNGLNYFGLWEAFVPNQRFTTLQQAASAQIQAAGDSVKAFLGFLDKADDLKEREGDLQFQRTEELVNLDILQRKRAIATLGVDKIDEQLRAIDDQRKFLGVETVLGNFRAIVDGASKGGELGAVTSLAGVAGNIVNFLDQNEQLAHQRRTAQLDSQIARNQVAIVNLERRISELRLAFYAQKLAFLQGKRLNADVLYELAALNEKRAVRQLETAMLLAFLFERALAFNLGEVDGGRRIQFDYLDRPKGILDAVDALKADFIEVENQTDTLLEQQKISPFTESISLRESYPIQFSRFLQTGEMDFVYSLYQLSKSRPATHQCRLREVGVELRALVPPTGFSGILTHSGRFLVRDREATLDPDVTRLVPTEEQLAAALEEQRRQSLPAAVVGGVLYYSLEPESKELSQKTQFVSPDVPSQATLDLFEGIGPTGLWHLEIREHGKLAISDILLHLAIVSRESDPFVLEPKVEALIRSFERELGEGDLRDKISTFSLRQNFADVFFALQDGPVDLILTEDDFQSGLVNLQFKALIVQALDQTGKALPGVALEISRPEFSFNQARVTLADGFSEDLDAPPQTLPRDQRFALIGTWRLRLSSPAQFAQLGDLRLFFVHTFEEL